MKKIIVLLGLGLGVSVPALGVSNSAIERVLDDCESERSWKDEALCFRDSLEDLLDRRGRGGDDRSDFLRMNDHRLWNAALDGRTGDCTVTITYVNGVEKYQMGNENGRRQTIALDQRQAVSHLRNYLQARKCNL